MLRYGQIIFGRDVLLKDRILAKIAVGKSQFFSVRERNNNLFSSSEILGGLNPSSVAFRAVPGWPTSISQSSCEMIPLKIAQF